MNPVRPIVAYWKSWPRRRRRVFAWVAGLLVFYTVFGFLVLPLIVRAVATKRLARELNREVAIESVRINPYSMSCGIRGLMIKDRDGEPFISWDNVYVNLQLASLFGKAWVFKEFSTTNTYVRVQMDKDRTFNFSDLLEKFAAAGEKPSKPSKPLALRIERLSIRGARASLTDMTPRRPFSRMAGPLEITLNDFYTDPSSKNPYSFTGSTDSGEVFSWSGYFFLNPIRAAGELSVANVSLNKYAALYEDFVRFDIQDGVASLRGAYQFEQTPGTNIVLVTNVSAALRSLRLADKGSSNTLVEVPGLSVAQLSGDLLNRRVEVGSLAVTGAVLNLQRAKDASINVVEMAQPAVTATNAPGGILVLLRAVTNVFSTLLSSTNVALASLNNLSVENCAVSLQDEFQSRPVRLNLDEINVVAKNLSNVPGSNLTANVSLRWNTNGAIKTDVTASLVPLAADVALHVAQLEFHPLDPYLEPYVNLFILGSKLGLDGRIQMRATAGELPVVTFDGASTLADFSTVDGVMAEELIKWRLLEINGIKANLNPPEVSVTKVGVNDAFARIALETNRTINLLAALRPANSNLPPATPTASVQKTTSAQSKKALAQVKEIMSRTNAMGLTNVPKFNIATIVISNAHLQLADRSLLPHVRASVQQINGTITDISSEELRRAQISISAKVDNTGPVEISGQFNPLHREAASDFKVVFRDVDLNPTDPYMGKFLGYRLRKGKLSMEVNYSLSADHLKGRNLIHLDQFTLGDKVQSPDATKLPVKLGLALLKDRSGKIELDVPVEGNLDDPEFRFGRVIWRAVGNVFTKIVTSPFAALGALFGGRNSEEARYQDFDPGASEIQPAGREKLDALANALYERPGLEVEIEGQVDAVVDTQALRRQKLERQLRAAKWATLRKSDQSSIAAEHVLVTPEEHSRYLTELHKKNVGENVTPADAGRPAIRTAVLRGSAKAQLKGAAFLIQQPTPEEQQQALAVMERQLLEAMVVEESDLQALASSRAQQVQFYLIQSGKVNSDRVYLMRSDEGRATTNAARAVLNLR
jgi:uncharacterized protein DUF748